MIRSKTREEWCALLEGTDVCFAPVLGLDEAPQHPHNRARESFVDVGGRPQPAPAPRFGATPADPPRPGVRPGAHSREVLADAGYSETEIESLFASGAVS